MDHVERLVTTERTWRDLRTRVETATRKVDLRQVEDQVDAVVCAYVALFAERWPERTTTYGDFERGYIVTPTLPDAHATIRARRRGVHPAPTRPGSRTRRSTSRWSPRSSTRPASTT